MNQEQAELNKPWLDKESRRRIEEDKKTRNRIEESLCTLKNMHLALREEFLQQMKDEFPDYVGYIEEQMEKLLTFRKGSKYSTRENANVNVKLISDTDFNVNLNALPYISLGSLPLTEPSYLIENFLPSDCISLIYGDGGQGKSYLSLYLAVLIAIGKPFLGMVVKKGKLLYLDFELSPELQRQRLERICKGLSIEPACLANNLFYLAPGIQDNIPANLTELIPVVNEDDFDLIIIDSIGAALTGDPEAARDICRLFQQIRELGTVLLLDHQAKKQKGDKASEKTPFGSAYKFNLSRNVWHLNAKPSEDNTLNCLLRHTKSNFSALRESLGLSFRFDNGAFTIETYEPGPEFSEHLSLKDQIIIALSELGEATAKEIAEEAGLELNSVKATITILKREGKVEDTSKKKGNASVYSLNVKNKEDLINVNTNAQPNTSSDHPNVDSIVDNVKSAFNAEEVPEDAPF